MPDFTYEEAIGQPAPPVPSTPPSPSRPNRQFTYEEAMGQQSPPAARAEIDFGDLIPKRPASKISFADLPDEKPRPISFDDLPDEVAPTPAYRGQNISFEDLVPKNPPLTQAYPPKPAVPTVAPSMLDQIKRQAGLTARYGLQGVTKALSFPVNAVADAVGGVTSMAGNPQTGQYIKDTYGTAAPTGGGILADAMGLPTPQGKLEKAVGAGAEAMAGGALGTAMNAVSGGSKAVSALLPGANTSGALVGNAAVASALDAAPKQTLGVAGAVGAATLTRKGMSGTANAAENVMQNRAYNQLFDGNKFGLMDAEILRNLGAIKKTEGGTLGADGAQALSASYVQDLTAKLKQAGVSSDDITQAIQGRKALSALDPDVINRLKATPEGNTVLDTLAKSNRAALLTSPSGNQAQSGNGILSGIGSVLTDTALSAVAGIPAPVTTLYKLAKKAIGGIGNDGDTQVAKLTSDRNLRAADTYLTRNPESASTIGLGVLAQQGQQRAADAQGVLSQSTAALDALKTKARQISGTPGGGAYQALLEHTGLSSDDLNAVLRQAGKIPEAADAVRAIRVKGSDTASDAIYPLTDIVNSIADKLGMTRAGGTRSGGVAGAQAADNSGAPIRSGNLYAAKAASNQAGYAQDAQAINAAALPPVVKSAALAVNKTLATTGDPLQRKAAISQMLARHSEYQGALMKVFGRYVSE